VMGPTHVQNVAELACRTALARRGVAHITVPVDVQTMKVSQDDPRRSKRNLPRPPSDVFARQAGLPRERDLMKASHILNSGKRTAILVGQGALGAAEELEELAEVLGAPVIKALLGKAVLPDDSPYTTGGIGLLGTRPSQDAIEDCDTLLM